MQLAINRPRSSSLSSGIPQVLWQHVTLICILGYEAAGCLAGGILLIATPDGASMDMPVSLMRGAFSDFFVPGAILFGLGILNLGAFIALLGRWRSDWIWS